MYIVHLHFSIKHSALFEYFMQDFRYVYIYIDTNICQSPVYTRIRKRALDVCIYRALLRIYRVVWRIHRALLRVYRALLRICRALLWICERRSAT